MKKGILLFVTTAIVAGMMSVCGGSNSGGNPVDNPVTYTLTTASNPAVGGTVSPAGTSEHNRGASVTVTATAAQGYEFSGWTGAPSSVSASSASITFEMDGNLSLIANFKLTEGDGPPDQPVTYTLTTNANPSIGGTVDPAGTTTHNAGAEVEICAMETIDYEFTGWSGASASVTPCVSITMNENKTITANFNNKSQTVITHILTVTPNPTIGGTVTVDGAATIGATTLDNGTELEICAVAASGYRFTEWSGASSSANACITVIMNNDISLTAKFLQTYTLTTNANPSGGGNVFVDDVELSAGTKTFDAGTTVTVRAQAAADYEFTNWIGAPASVNAQQSEVTFLMNGNVTLIANFANTVVPPTPHTLTTNIAPSGGGTVTRVPNLANYDAGTLVTVTATPNAGYNFVGWTGDLTSNNTEISFDINSDITLTANFIKVHTITVIRNPTLGGGYAIRTDSQIYTDGTVVEVCASPSNGYAFRGWSGASTSASPCITLTMNGDLTLTANFAQIRGLTITRDVATGGTVSVDGSTVLGSGTTTMYQNAYDDGASVQVCAVTNSGYAFTGWSGASTSTNSCVTLVMNSHRTLTANFSQIMHTLTITRNTNLGGLITVNGTTSTETTSHAFGSEVEVCAVANATGGYAFTGWSGASTSTNSCVTLVMNSNRTLSANFVPLLSFTVARNLAAGGTVSVDGTTVLGSGTATTNTTAHINGTSIQVCATAANNYIFAGWSGASTSTNACVTVTVTPGISQSLTANFQHATYTLTVSRSIAVGGTVSVGGAIVLGSGAETTHTSTHNNGAIVQVCATPNENYTYGSTGTLQACQSVTMDSDKSLLADFALIRRSLTVTRSPAEGGTVTVDGADVFSRPLPNGDLPTNSVSPHPHGTSTEVCVIPNSGWRHHNSSAFSNGCITIVMDQNRTAPIQFVRCTPGVDCPFMPGDQFNPNINYGTFTDSRDGKVYRTVAIGTQTWMAENLNFAGTSGNVGVCYSNIADNCAKYGRLYTWVEAMNIDPSFRNTWWNGNDTNHQGICPAGWRVPNNNDWNALVTTVGGSNIAGSRLKSQTGWEPPDWGDWGVFGSTDEFGFSALPGGVHQYIGGFAAVGIAGQWWSTMETTAAHARHQSMRSNDDGVGPNGQTKDNARSVRCVRD